MTQPAPGTPDAKPKAPDKELKEVLLAFLAIGVGVALTAAIMPAFLQEYAYSILLAAMVYAPWLRIEKRRGNFADYGLHLKTWKKDILVALFWMAVIFPLFILGNHVWQSLIFHKSVAFRLPEKSLLLTFLEQTFVIALCEEIFYRGWMQTVFTGRWPAKTRILGGDFGAALFATSALFALGHLASIPSPARLAVFFPSLWFGWLRSRTGSIIAPMLAHGASNTLMAFLVACYNR